MASVARNIAGRSVRIDCADDLEPQAASVLAVLARQSAAGLALRPGSRIRYGWSILILQERDGGLLVCEPDYASNPFQRTREDLSVFLRVTQAQVRLAQVLGVTPAAVSFQDKLVHADGVFESPRLYAQRTPPQPEKHDSGWFVGYLDGDNSAPNLRSCHVYQLLRLKPILMQALVLPTGCIVMLDDDRIRNIVGPDNESLLKGRGGAVQAG